MAARAPAETSSPLVAADDGEGEGRSWGALCRTAAKKLLDYSALIAGFSLDFAWVSVEVACLLVVALAALALLVDWCHCRRKQAAGLPAVWPKPIAVTFLVMNSVILALLEFDALSEDSVRVWSGLITSGGLLLMALASMALKRPFLYADAVDVVPAATLRDPARLVVFRNVLEAMSWAWCGAFAVLLLLSAACGVMRVYGVDAGVWLGPLLGLTVVHVMIRYVYPSVKRRAMAETEAGSP